MVRDSEWQRSREGEETRRTSVVVRVKGDNNLLSLSDVS